MVAALVAATSAAFAQEDSGAPDASTPPDGRLDESLDHPVWRSPQPASPEDTRREDTGQPADTGRRQPPPTAGDGGNDPVIQGVREVMSGEGAAQNQEPGGNLPLGGDAQTGAPERDFGFTYYLQVFAALCLVIALILVAGYAVRRFGGSSPLVAGAQLGRVMGRIYLTKGASLYFVHTGGRVLVIGLTGSTMRLLADFDPATFDTEDEYEEDEAQQAAYNPDQFLAQLQASMASMDHGANQAEEDDEIASLRGDIQRLQRYLQEESRPARE